MAQDYEQTIRVKNFECNKLRQVIKELTEKCDGLIDENQDLKKSFKEISDQSCKLGSSLRPLKKELNETKFHLLKAVQTESDLKESFEQLRKDNHKLMEELLDIKKHKLRADEEIATISEENYQLTFDLTSSQQENSALKVKLAKGLLDVSEKDQTMQKLSQSLYHCQQQNKNLHKELNELSALFKDVKATTDQKEVKIGHLSRQLEESFNNLQQQNFLEEKIKQVQEENLCLRLEIQNTDKSRDKLADTLLKNKTLLVENKTLKGENENLSKENAILQGERHKYKDKIITITSDLEMKLIEFGELKARHEELKHSYHEVNKELTVAEECLKQKHGLEEKNRLLGIKCQAYDAEMEKLNKALSNVLRECCDLKCKIEELERSNVKKINIIAKLKTENFNK